MNEKWDEVGPVFLELNDSTEEPTRVARSIRDYYLGDKNVSYTTRHDAIKVSLFKLQTTIPINTQYKLLINLNIQFNLAKSAGHRCLRIGTSLFAGSSQFSITPS
jgi:hypothetical protein